MAKVDPTPTGPLMHYCTSLHNVLFRLSIVSKCYLLCRFGYDTGVGYNRQFRYEERDNAGVLHGRYGYYDQAGKLQIVNYSADPQTGFHAEGEHVPKPQY